MKLSIVQSLIVKIICSILCSIQLYITTEKYLQFQVLNNVKFEYDKNVELPAIDIMLKLGNIINVTNFCSKYETKLIKFIMPLVNSDLYANCSCSEKCTKGLTELLNDERGLPNIFPIATIYENIEPILSMPLAVDWVTGVEIICDSFNYINLYVLILRRVCRKAPNDKLQEIKIELFENMEYGSIWNTYQHPFRIRFTDPNDYPSFSLNSYQFIDEINTVHRIKYKKIIFESLEYPYETNCRNYDRMKTMSDCIAEFLWNESPRYLHPHLLIQLDDFSNNSKYNNIYFEVDLSSLKLDKTYINCMKTISKPQCKQIIFTLTKEKSYEKTLKLRLEVEDSNLNVLDLVASTEPVNIITAYPAFPLLEYLIYIGSILGLWFGFSISDGLNSGLKLSSFYFFRKWLKKERSNSNFKSQKIRKSVTNKINTGQAIGPVLFSAKMGFKRQNRDGN